LFFYLPMFLFLVDLLLIYIEDMIITGPEYGCKQLKKQIEPTIQTNPNKNNSTFMVRIQN
jgi:hypothetical protein